MHGDARSAKSFEVLPLIFSTDCSHDCSPIYGVQSVLKFTRFGGGIFSCFNKNHVSRSWRYEIELSIVCMSKSMSKSRSTAVDLDLNLY